MIVSGCNAPTSCMLQHMRFGFVRAIKLPVYHIHNAMNLLRDLAVPESQDAVALGLEPLRSLLIAFTSDIFAMLRAINFDNEASRRTDEIDNKVSDRHLAAEVRAAYLKPS